MQLRNVLIMIPFFTGSDKNYVKITVHDPIDRRKIKRLIRKMVKHNFQRSASTNFIRHSCIVVHGDIHATLEASTNPRLEDIDAPEAGEPMRDMQDTIH